MSEIRERAQRLVNMLREKDDQMCWESLAMSSISSLLAELERVENSREAECMECEKLACIEMRQQAAREVVEIIDKYPAFLFGADAVGVKLNLSQSIKARFGLDG